MARTWTIMKARRAAPAIAAAAVVAAQSGSVPERTAEEVAAVREREVAYAQSVAPVASAAADAAESEPEVGNVEDARFVASAANVTADLAEAASEVDDLEDTQIVPHADPITAEPPTPAAVALDHPFDSRPSSIAPAPPLPAPKPQDRERTHEIVALLKRAGANAPPPARRSTAADQPQSPASAEETDPSIAALRRELAARDEVIASLLARVEQLEQHVLLSPGQLDQVVAGAASSRGTHDSSSPAVPASPPASSHAAAQAQPAHDDAASGAPPAPAAPGQFEVDEDDVDRALERTLVEQGVLLLPWGQAQIEPSFSYTRQVANAPTFVTEDGTTFVGEVQVRRNEFTSGQNLRIGLPFDAQAEIAMPYQYVEESTVTRVGFGERRKSSASGYGPGDIQVGLAKTLLRENGSWWPDLVGRLRWSTDTGRSSDGGVALGGGFKAIAGSLSAVKRQDPLAFVAGASYERAFEHNSVRPGDKLGFSLGTVLAASPETSLSLSFSQSFADEVEVGGRGLDGSDRVSGVLSIGAASILGHGLFVNTSVDIGLTADAPDYAVRASIPIRFNLPGY